MTWLFCFWSGLIFAFLASQIKSNQVRKRRPPDLFPKLAADDREYRKDLKYLMEDEEHKDAVFLLENALHDGGLNDDPLEIRVHRSILTARSDYFKALFRSDTFSESEQCVVRVEAGFSEAHVRGVLSFLYTNRVPRITQSSTEHLLALFQLADQWLLPSLKKTVERELVNHVAAETVARLYSAAEDYGASGGGLLKTACVEYIRSNLKKLTANPDFEAEIQRHSPALTLHILKRAAETSATQHHQHHSTRHSKKARRTSPVPDAEPSSGGFAEFEDL